MDFGTTNSGMAAYDGRAVSLLPLDPSNANPRVARTSLYVTNDQSITIGREAVDRYFQQNVARPVKLQRVWIGELEIRGADMYYVTDAYAYVDVFSPGRLFLSMKTSLRDAEYAGTVVGQYYYPLEDLIALYMSATRLRAERVLGHEIRQVVLGRPVHFATDPEHDALAQSRLLQAAFRAGYEKVYLQYEPVAAAYSYETSIEAAETALIFDFGGGTLDLTVMRLGDPKGRAVLATGGIPVAGDVFDQKLVRAKLPRHFGEGSYYGPRQKALTIPHWIYDTFSNWQTILELQSVDNKRILEEISQTAQRRYQIEALINLVANNYGLPMFDLVERAKRRLSEKRGAEILLEGPGFKVREFVTRTEFESIIRAEILAIERHIDETLQASGLAHDQLDVVIRTGGSSQIPVFHEMLQRKFGADKVRDVDTFSSVTAGLGVIARGIMAGEVEARAYLPEDVVLPNAPHSRPNVAPVNLSVVQRRIKADEAAPRQEDGGFQRQAGLILLGVAGEVAAVLIPAVELQQERSISLAPVDLPGDLTTAMTLADLDEQLLLVTTRYRFLLTTPRQLVDLAEVGLAITDVHQLEPYERISTVSSWHALKQSPKMLLVTSGGHARTYPMNILRTNIEAPVPMRFDRALPGVPVVTSGVQGDELLAIVTRQGRVSRHGMRQVLTSGFQAVNCGREDRVTGVALAQDGRELLLVTADGYGRRLLAEWVPVSDRPNVKGKVMVARRSDVVAMDSLSAGETIWLATSSQLASVDFGHLPQENSTRSYGLLKLAKGETVRGCFKFTHADSQRS
jgi:hypothetical chaperone protein